MNFFRATDLDTTDTTIRKPGFSEMNTGREGVSFIGAGGGSGAF